MIRGQHTHTSTDIPSTPLVELAPGSTYACCVAPFTAVADTAAFAPEEAAATVTVRVPGRGRLTLPMWFAEEYVTSIAIPAKGSKHLAVEGCGQTRIMVPQDDVDEHQPVFVTQLGQRIPGWREVAVFGSQNAPQPPPLPGTPSERAVAVHAKANIILADCNTVQHAVIPRLVFQHVVCPFVTMIKCTASQACLGVTALDVDLDSPLSKALNVTELTAEAIPARPLPPKTRSLVVRQKPPDFPFGVVRHAPSQRNILQNSMCGLTSLEFHVSIDVEQLGTTPMPTLRKLVLHTLQHTTGANSDAAIRHVSSLTPNVLSLTFREDAVTWGALMLCFVASADCDDGAPVWPHATSLDYAGSWTSAAVVASTRPWELLVLRIPDDSRRSPHKFERLALALVERQYSKLTDSLLKLSIHFSRRGGDPTRESLRLLTSLCPKYRPKKLRSLTVPCMTISFPPNRIASAFFSQAQALEELSIDHFDVGSSNADVGNRNNTARSHRRADASDDEVTAAFNAAFPASLRCVSSDRSSLQWKCTGMGEDARWRSGPLPTTVPLPTTERSMYRMSYKEEEHDTQQPQVLLVTD